MAGRWDAKMGSYFLSSPKDRSGKTLDNSPGDLFDQELSEASDQLKGNDSEDGRDV